VPAPESVRDAYGQVESLTRAIGDVVTSTLRTYCNSNGYLYFGRVKTLESTSEKIEGGRVDKWSKLDDLYACTIIVPTASHEPSVLRKLDACFDQVTIRSRDTTQKAPDVFRFDATRYYGRLTADQAETRQPSLNEIVFEVQINTVFEFAWTRVTHDLVYKSDTVDWRRLRLAAQLKASVEQIEATIGAFEQTAAVVQQSSWSEIEVKLKIVNFFKELLNDGIVMTQLAPTSWRRFADNVYQLVASYSKNNYAVADKVDELLGELSATLRGPEAKPTPASGTLFQLVLGHVGLDETTGNLNKFTVVDSIELPTLYQITNIPKKFLFDLPEAQFNGFDTSN